MLFLIAFFGLLSQLNRYRKFGFIDEDDKEDDNRQRALNEIDPEERTRLMQVIAKENEAADGKGTGLLQSLFPGKSGKLVKRVKVKER